MAHEAVIFAVEQPVRRAVLDVLPGRYGPTAHRAKHAIGMIENSVIQTGGLFVYFKGHVAARASRTKQPIVITFAVEVALAGKTGCFQVVSAFGAPQARFMQGSHLLLLSVLLLYV